MKAAEKTETTQLSVGDKVPAFDMDINALSQILPS